MAEQVTKLPVKTETPRTTALQAWRPFESFRREIDRLFDNFAGSGWGPHVSRSSFDVEPFRRRDVSWGAAPAVDIVESDKAFEITAELPGIDEKNIEVTLTNGGLTIKGEKHEEKEEKKKDYYLQERHFG